jgi:glycosyltransferase involved in cell wall biosynthesis
MDKLSQPLVSIVFTSYNHKEYLRQALDSLLNQTYPNTEIIIIDDCSTDGSQEILKEYEHFGNINLKFQTQNSGSYVKASNLGASFAKGDYLLFAQCDDFAEPNQIELLIQAFLYNPTVGVVFSKSNLVDNNGTVFSNDFIGRERNFKKSIALNPLLKGNQIQEFLFFSCVIPNLSAALIKTKLYHEVGGLSDKYLVVADWEFWLDLSILTDFYYVIDALNNFRQHETTIRSSIKMKTQILEINGMFNRHDYKYKLSKKLKYKMRVGFGAIWFVYFLVDKKIWVNSFFSVYTLIKEKSSLPYFYLFLGIMKQLKEYYFRKSII